LAAYEADGAAELVRSARADRGEHRIPGEMRALIEGMALRRPPPRESGTNRGRLRGLILPVGGVGEVGVPALVVVGEGVVEYPGADLEQ